MKNLAEVWVDSKIPTLLFNRTMELRIDKLRRLHIQRFVSQSESKAETGKSGRTQGIRLPESNQALNLVAAVGKE